MVYIPKPVDTSHVELPAELSLLLEDLALHVHETWAKQRLDDGWSYGPQRDDRAKTHPCLVPFDQLPESEKVYDRQTAAGTLKMIIGLGYEIRRAS